MEATEVLHKKKVRNPKLRFKGFSDDWKIDSLTNLYSEIVVGFVGTVSSDYCDESEGVQFVRTLNVKDGWFSNEGLQYVSKVFHLKNKKSQVKNGDILIARVGANMGLVCEISGLIGEANSANVIIIKNQTNLSSRFYASYLSSSKGQKQIQSKGAGGAQEVLNISVAKTINVPFLSLPEQQKIASFLSAVDEKIQQLTRKKELLEQYKKGVMQQLFSGKLRFKDENGKAFPNWEEKKLGDVSKIYDGTHQTPTYVKEGIPFYSVEHVTANQFTNTKYISKEVFEKENEKVRLEKGDILMTKIGDIGTARLIDWDVEASFYVSLALLKQSKFILPKYLNQYIASRNFQLELWKRIIHVAFPKKINLGEIGNCKILVPVLEEQKKIANYLSDIDYKIDSVNNQITQTQTFKKGMLQQMFV